MADADAPRDAVVPTLHDKPRNSKSSFDSRSGWRPATGPPPSSAAGYSTREPSREHPPASAGLHSNFGSEGDMGSTARGRLTAASGRSRSNSQRVSLVSSTRGVVLTMFDDEVARLRPEHENKITRVEKLKEQLKEAKREEQHEAREQTIHKAERLQRRLKVTSRMQACVRGWLVRKRVVAALDHRTVQNLKHAAMLPDLLRDQLMQLQHGVHDLEFRPEDRAAATVKLQAWWRGIAGRRVMKLVRLTLMLQRVTDQMAASATVIQAWYRGVTTKIRLRHIIHVRMEETRKLEYSIMQTALKCIIQIQRGYRSKLARRAMRKRRTLAAEEKEARGSPISLVDSVDDDCSKKTMIDSWRPSKGPGAIAAGSGDAGVIIDKPPQHDRELEKIENMGLVPFYDASSERQVRHQIGGPTATMMQQQLAIGDDEDGIIAVDDLASLEKQLGETWGIYPNGFTQGFLPGLDNDVWERGGRAKSYRNSLALRGVRRKKRRSSLGCGPRPCTVAALPPPSNTEERLALRRAQRTQSISTVSSEAVCAEPHPMFVNAPPQPALKSAPACGRSKRFVHADAFPADEDEGSWSFTAMPPPPKYRSERRPRGELENAQHNLWNTLGVPFDVGLTKKKMGEVDHDRVWSIAHALAERLPALTAG